MRSADGLALLREIARKHGPVEIVSNEGDVQPWTVRLSGYFGSPARPDFVGAHGATLEETVGILHEKLEKFRPRAVE